MAVSRPSKNPPKRASKTGRADAIPDVAVPDAPSTRLSGLMKRIQAKANGFVFHFKRNSTTKIDPCEDSDASDASGASGASGEAAVRAPEQYLYPGPVATVRKRRQDSASVASSASFKTWNAPVRTRPDLTSLGFRPDKHVTCIEVTLVNNQPQIPAPEEGPRPLLRMNSGRKDASERMGFRQRSATDLRQIPNSPSPYRKQSGSKSEAVGKSATLDKSAFRNPSGMRTYCFGEQPESPCGTLSSRSSSGASDPDSGYEEAVKTPQPELSVVFRTIFSPRGGSGKNSAASGAAAGAASGAASGATPPAPPPVKVQAKRSTIRREKAFRNRNKKAREMERNNELLERFHEIRKRLGDEEEEEDAGADRWRGGGAKAAVSAGRLVQLPEASVVKNLVRQWNTANGGQFKSREKIVASRLNSKRSAQPLRPPRLRQQVKPRPPPRPPPLTTAKDSFLCFSWIFLFFLILPLILF